jgi:hypothetical protein
VQALDVHDAVAAVAGPFARAARSIASSASRMPASPVAWRVGLEAEPVELADHAPSSPSA